MRLYEINFRPTPQVLAMSDAERHEWLKFIYEWLAGQFMRDQPTDILERWSQLAKLFPPKVPSEISLFRLVTVPVKYAAVKQFSLKPALGKVSSWTRTLVGLDAVAGIATDMSGDRRVSETARIGIEATIPGHLVLATPMSIRNAFMTLSHDYFERYKETPVEYTKDGVRHLSVTYPGWPGGDDAMFAMDDVGFLQDVLNRPGGHYRQYEYVVETPPKVDATVVQIYRIGVKDIRMGNDDPHHGKPPRVRRLRHA